jgi:tetratricopeptide (TPR) repeat protein
VPRLVLACFLAVLALTPACADSAFQHDHGQIPPERLGKVHFVIFCTPKAQDVFNVAVATLHSFGYRDAEQRFLDVLKVDPTCSMADWGIAMSHYHQLWDPPAGEDLRVGLDAVQKGLALGPKTERERDYLNAIRTFYQDADFEDHRVRAKRYELAMEALHEHYPRDSEAAIFHALALIADAPSSDKSYANQRKATGILEPLFERQPDHPGLAHYIIHADDHLALAPHALRAARRYAQIAPDSPHALHMPSHIFTRLGFWEESISANLASAVSARQHELPSDELHALDYLVYAYLQTGRIAEAGRLTQHLPVPRTGEAARYAGLYASATIPARFAIERQQWLAAAALPLSPQDMADSGCVSTQSNLAFARALGAARLGDTKGARAAMELMLALRETCAQAHEQDKVGQIDIQQKVVSAWIKWAEGDHYAALRMMKEAAVLDDASDTSPGSPGPVAPAEEMLGDMLLQAKQPALAMAAYESALKAAPERLRSEYGAASSAQEAGDRATAERYYRKLLVNCSHGDSDLPEFAQAKQFLDIQERPR